MTCGPCELSKQQLNSGLYQMTCVKCCARLVLSAHPSKPHAAGMLAAIARHKDAPARVDILESVNQMLTKLR